MLEDLSYDIRKLSEEELKLFDEREELRDTIFQIKKRHRDELSSYEKQMAFLTNKIGEVQNKKSELQAMARKPEGSKTVKSSEGFADRMFNIIRR
jgi:predicted  nucleic acid-binding Zn-ribbon protein